MKKILFTLLTIINIYAYDAFITTDSLKDALNEQNLVIIDVSDSYKKSHIIGAISFDTNLLRKSDTNSSLASMEELQEIFRDIGINNDSNVVIYGRNSNNDIKKSAFLAFVLISHGFENVSILDGGYMAWVFEHDMLTSREERDIQEGNLVLTSTNISVDIKYIQSNKKSKLIDARYPEKYYGISNNENDIYAGHIPGAKNSYCFYKFLRDKRIRTQEELEKIYVYGLELGKLDDIIVYGENELDAAIEWYIIYKKMGYTGAKLYYNSFKEYAGLGLETQRFKWE
ncbi:thiosulfate sulfurtransferase [Sulfurimonas lithotrophica]|uniref:Thiosulfate sulfurtransferase n=1 Tax=Sulfurimonas lithotrophica TaxID=2590022 RepID=A0A5P8P3B4_9BACT|nr:rhodanese-like domain-containing protein [Sulfurimonas lithotrophica]QFR50087.1 thiosulfate sulfurtransferase [Sulfurimonas lithotrophica]